MEAKLRVVGGAKPALIRLRLPTVVGRSQNATLKIRSAQISRRHCEIEQFEGELTVRDLGSSNGTYVNGQRISELTFLSPGDELRIGPLTLRAEYEVLATEDRPEGTQDAEAASNATTTPATATPAGLPSADSAHDVVEDGPTTEHPGSGISSIVRYEENEGGSFLGIEEISAAGKADSNDVGPAEAGEKSTVAPPGTDADADDSPPPDSPPPATDEGGIDLDVGTHPKSVDPGDSQLNKFFDGLS